METVGINPLLSLLIGEGLATLLELETVYSYEDALMMAEALSVKRYNEWLGSKKAQEKNGLR